MSFDPHCPTEPIPVVRVLARRPHAPVAALLGLGLLGLAGAWLIAAPFLLGYHGLGDQRRGAAWTDATRVDVSLGAAILAVSVAALLGYLAAAVTWLARYRQAEWVNE
ncbi:hypothetical protein [Actinospica sp.]|uniref:hypothetical protein n=1 Tax=Actinospica sp. TaxID=1872142 RepID=UPI002C11333A|nr:hypothetical protein [Actinospica sp.]HWG24915.1 hypothetical protein [Actinospica sp.]